MIFWNLVDRLTAKHLTNLHKRTVLACILKEETPIYKGSGILLLFGQLIRTICETPYQTPHPALFVHLTKCIFVWYLLISATYSEETMQYLTRWYLEDTTLLSISWLRLHSRY